MVHLHQFDYIFAIGVIFDFLDAWIIGANDVTNSFASSVSSRPLKIQQAMCIGIVTEFADGFGVQYVSSLDVKFAQLTKQHITSP